MKEARQSGKFQNTIKSHKEEKSTVSEKRFFELIMNFHEYRVSQKEEFHVMPLRRF